MSDPEAKNPEPEEGNKALIEFAAQANKVLEEVVTETYVMGLQNGPYHSAHEAFADLLQTMDAVKVHVWASPSQRDLLMMDRDCSLLVSKALRMILDVCRGGDITYQPGKE